MILAHSRRLLCLVRHAKSAYPPGVPDFERPLAPRGSQDAPVLGQWLTGLVSQRGCVLVSSAVRTRQTWALANTKFLLEGDVLFDHRIYEATVGELLAVIAEISDDKREVVVVGHNPGLSELALSLSHTHGDEEVRERVRKKFPTSAILTLHTDAPWSQIGTHGAVLGGFDTARSGESPIT